MASPWQEPHPSLHRHIRVVYHSTSARIGPTIPPSQELLPGRLHGKNFTYDITSARLAPMTPSHDTVLRHRHGKNCIHHNTSALVSSTTVPAPELFFLRHHLKGCDLYSAVVLQWTKPLGVVVVGGASRWAIDRRRRCTFFLPEGNPSHGFAVGFSRSSVLEGDWRKESSLPALHPQLNTPCIAAHSVRESKMNRSSRP